MASQCWHILEKPRTAPPHSLDSARESSVTSPPSNTAGRLRQPFRILSIPRQAAHPNRSFGIMSTDAWGHHPQGPPATPAPAWRLTLGDAGSAGAIALVESRADRQ